MPHEHFTHAPITEALIDIRVNLPQGFDTATLAKVGELVAEMYPSKVELFSFEQRFEAGPEGPIASQASSNRRGFQFTSSDGLNLLQARRDGFSHHRLRPYDRWDSFVEEAKRLWNAYKDVTAPMNVTRLAIRYINQIDIPLPFTDLKDYLVTGPELAPGMKASMQSYFFQTSLVQSGSDHVTLLTQATGELPIDQKYLPIIFDLDVFVERVFEANDDRIWDEFEGLRSTRNDVFYNSLTDKCKELFR